MVQGGEACYDKSVENPSVETAMDAGSAGGAVVRK